MTTSKKLFPRPGHVRGNARLDSALAAALVIVVILAWCTAYHRWTRESFGLPLTYGNPVYSDFIGSCAYIKGLAEGGGRPFFWKSIPQLAAPDAANWALQPTPDEALSALFVTFYDVCGLFTAFNIGAIVGHLLAAVTFYFVARRWLEAAPTWSFIGALAFALAPYLFAESPHHINCLYAWHLPLFPVVWTWVTREPAPRWGTRHFWQAMVIGVLTGLQNPYYTFIFCQILLLAAATCCWRRRSWDALVFAAAVVAAAAVGFLVSNLDTVSYRLLYGGGDAPVIAQREYRWMDVYGFKIVDLFIPWITHHSEAFARFGLAHRQSSILNDEEGCAYLGILGIGCLLFLVATSVRALVEGRNKDVPPEFWWVLWIVIFFNTGGLNSVIAAFTGFTLFRTAVRYSVVVLVIALLHAARRLSEWSRNEGTQIPADVLRIGTATAAIAACLLVLWDQVPRSPTAEQTATIARAVQSDRDFVGRLEQVLPDKAMVFQLPVMDGTPLPSVTASDHYRPYLYSSHLHWSHGALPGSQTLQWQQAVQKQLVEGAALDQQLQQIRFNIANSRKAIEAMRNKGFNAVFINRNGFPDRGKGLFDALLELGYEKPPIYSPAGDLACIVLEASPEK